MKRMAFLSVLFSVAVCNGLYSQPLQDTAAMVKEFRKVMNFALQPYVYYTTVTNISSDPIIEATDTLHTNGIFYKNNTDIYYENGPETVYLQDSLLIQVNHERKTIWVSRVDMASKERLNTMPVGNKQLQEIMRKNYSMNTSVTDSNTNRLHFETRQRVGQSGVVSNRINLDYTASDHLPNAMEIEMHMQQPADEDMISQIKAQGVDDSKLIQLINGAKYLVRMQKLQMVFGAIDFSKEKAAQMPLWKEVITFNPAEQQYTGKAALTGYEVTKTF